MNSTSAPALAPPPGQTSNFVDPPSMAWQNTVAMAIYIVVVTPFVIARVYTRQFIQKGLWWDDAAQVLATAFLYAMAALCIQLTNLGGGRDLWNVTKSNYAVYNHLFGITEIIARFGITFTKLSILLLYLRYFCPTKSKRGKIFWATWAVIVFNILYSLSLILVVELQCIGTPHLKAGQECINENLVLVMASTINVITDVMILFIPIAAVWVMKMSRKLKIGLLVVFSVGFLGVLSSVARLVYQVPQNDNENRTVVNTIVLILALAEQAIGQVAGCMPVLPSLYRHFFGDKDGSQNKSYNKYGSYGSGNGDSSVGRSRSRHNREQGSYSEPIYSPMSPRQYIDMSVQPPPGKDTPASVVADRYRQFRQHSATANGDYDGIHHHPSCPQAQSRNEIGVARTVTVNISSANGYRSQ